MPLGSEKEFQLGDKATVKLYRVVAYNDNHRTALGIEINGIAATQAVKYGQYCREEGKHPHYLGAANYLIDEFEKMVRASNYTQHGALGEFNEDRQTGTDEMTQRFTYNQPKKFGLDRNFASRSDRLFKEFAEKLEKEWMPKANQMVHDAKQTIEAPDWEEQTEAGQKFRRMVSKAEVASRRYAEVASLVSENIGYTTPPAPSVNDIAHTIIDSILPQLLGKSRGVRSANVHSEHHDAKAAVQNAYLTMDDDTAQKLGNLIADELLPEERRRRAGRN